MNLSSEVTGCKTKTKKKTIKKGSVKLRGTAVILTCGFVTMTNDTLNTTDQFFEKLFI